ncbi:MAG: SpoIID/LytB domain-containing protein [Ruminococcaceae bacterium]|nr:SpoIID/LytB domain-containing protein [Oscillospiraceae bacterium]
MKNKILSRIFAIILAALMILGIVYSAFYSVITASADSNITFYPIDTKNMIRVAKKFKFSTTDCRAFSQQLGSTGSLGVNFYTLIDGNNIRIDLPYSTVMLVCDRPAKLASDGLYYLAKPDETPDLTPYSLISDHPFSTLNDCKNAISTLPENVKTTGAYPIIKKDGYYIGIGYKLSKTTLNEITVSFKTVGSIGFSPYEAKDTMISVIDKASENTLFKIDTEELKLFAYPVQPDGGVQTYELINEHRYTYRGKFEYTSDSVGMTMINTVDIDDYIKGILPYEISPSWPYEALKTFAIILRSYTIAGYDIKHPNNDYDFCDETHCQAYRGTIRANANTNKAVDDTKNLVCAYNGEPAMTFFHAISGGSTISYTDAWDWSSNKYPYLVSVDTPLENYKKYSNGEWVSIVTKDELSSYLLGKSKISNKLSTAIVDVKISDYLENGYAYALTLTDINGNTAIYRQADEVRNILTKYVKSSKFRISYPATLVINDNTEPFDTTSDQLYTISADESGNTYVSQIDPTVKAITADGYADTGIDDSTYVFTGEGWGHGVGISQYGIKDMVDQGYKCEEIIKTYFPTVSIVSIDTIHNPMKD